MTPKQIAVIERAKLTPARFLTIPRNRGPRVGDATLLLRQRQQERRSSLLEAELMRLFEAWSNVS